MKKNFQTTLIMAAVLVALVAWFILYEVKARPKQAEAEEKSKQLISLKADEIQEFSTEWMTNGPGDTDPLAALPKEPKFEMVAMKKTAAEWSMISPVEDAGDTTTTNSELSTLATAKWERVVDEDPKDLAQYGLNPPLVKITVRKNSSTPPETVLVGRNTPTGFGIYFKIENRKPVYKGVRALRTSFDKGVRHFRNKMILNLPRADITEMTIERGKESIVLIKEKRDGDKDEWVLAREHLPAEILEVQKLLNGLVDSKAMDFADNEGKNLEKFGLAKPEFKVIVVHGIDKSRKTVLVGKTKDNKFFVKRDDKPFVYQIDKDTYGKLDRTAQSFRSMRLANFNRFDVKRIKIVGQESIELLKEEKGWTLPTKPDFKVDGAKIDSLLTTVQDSKVTQYLFGQKPEKVTNPKLVLQIFEKKDGNEAEVVGLKFASNPSAKNYLGARKDLDMPFFFKEEDFKKLNVSLKDIEKKEETTQKTEKATEKPSEHHEGDGHDHGHGHGHDAKPTPSKKT